MMERVKDAIDDDEKTIEETKKEFDKVHDKIRFKAFGKVTMNTKESVKNKREVEVEEGKTNTDEEKAEELFEEQNSRAAEEVAK